MSPRWTGRPVINLTLQASRGCSIPLQGSWAGEKHRPIMCISQYLAIWHLYSENLACSVSIIEAQELANTWGFAKLLLSGREIDCDLRVVRFFCVCVCAVLFIYKACTQSSVCLSRVETKCNMQLFCWCFQVYLSSKYCTKPPPKLQQTTQNPPTTLSWDQRHSMFYWFFSA